jgi:2'-5' RNA ligase
VRLFLAINLPDHARRAIVSSAEPLRQAAPTLGWIDESRLHLTLKFLGEQSESLVPSLAEAMDEVTSRNTATGIRLGGIGAFPNFRRARVVWMGVDQDPRLELLHHDVEVRCQTLGFELDARAFRPHLTLARVRQRPDVATMRKLSKASRSIDFETEVLVRSIDLMQSRLNAAAASGESRYELLHTSPLREAVHG